MLRSGAISRVGGVGWVILAVALVARLAVVAATEGSYVPEADAAEYDRVARSLADSVAYPPSHIVDGPTAFTPPGYPAALGAVYAVVGDGWTAGLILQAVLGTMVVALLGIVAWQLAGREVALVAAAIAAVLPVFWVPGAALLTEPLFLVLLLGALACVLRYRSQPEGMRWLLAAGALAGLACLTRTNGLIILLPLIAGVWMSPRRSPRSLLAPAILLGAAVVVIAPWTIRNAIELDRLVPVSTRPGFALERTYNELSRDHPVNPSLPSITPAAKRLVREPGLSEAEVASELSDRAWEFMRENPAYVAETMGLNLLRMGHLQDRWIVYESGRRSDLPLALVKAGIYSFVPLALLALFGALTRRAWSIPLFVWALPALLVLSALLTADGRVRYRAPIDPFLALLAGLAVVTVWVWWRERQGDPAEPHPASGRGGGADLKRGDPAAS